MRVRSVRVLYGSRPQRSGAGIGPVLMLDLHMYLHTDFQRGVA